MVKQLSTDNNTQRDSQSYVENRRRWKGEKRKSEESNQANNQILKWKWILKLRFSKIKINKGKKKLTKDHKAKIKNLG